MWVRPWAIGPKFASHEPTCWFIWPVFTADSAEVSMRVRQGSWDRDAIVGARCEGQKGFANFVQRRGPHVRCSWTYKSALFGKPGKAVSSSSSASSGLWKNAFPGSAPWVGVGCNPRVGVVSRAVVDAAAGALSIVSSSISSVVDFGEGPWRPQQLRRRFAELAHGKKDMSVRQI